MPQQHIYGTGIGSGFPPPTSSFQNQGGPLVQPPQQQLGTVGVEQPTQPIMVPASTALQQPQRNHMPPPPLQMSPPKPPSQIMATRQQQHTLHAVQQQSVSLPSSPAPMPQSSKLAQQQQYPPQKLQQQPIMARSNSMDMPSGSVELNSSQTATMGALKPVAQQQRLPPSMTNISQEANVQVIKVLSPLAATQDSQTQALQSQNNHQGVLPPPIPQQQHPPLQPQPQTIIPLGSTDNTSAVADTEEIRKLEQECEKKMQRATKSFGTRMDNLQRSKEEAEAQHRITLERHERERVEFEKRVRLAEDEQTRRLNQIQKEFIDKRTSLRASSQPLSEGVGAMPQVMQTNGNVGDGSIHVGIRPPLHGGHKRPDRKSVV